MITHIHGTLIAATPTFAILEASGVGYKIFITAITYGKLPPLQSNCLLHTVHVIREQSQALYGFLHSAACDLFETLLGVTGIGPKSALSILGHISETEFSHAIAAEDVTTLSKIPGIGKKTAQRLLIEMRDKLPIHDSVNYVSHASTTPQQQTIPWKLAINALVNLGYSATVAQKAVSKTIQSKGESAPHDLANLIADSLNNI